MIWPETVSDLADSDGVLRRRRYGVIEMCEGRLQAVHLRPWPTLFTWRQLFFPGAAPHSTARGDRCWLYYNQPRCCPGYLALKYVVSTRRCTLATFRGSLTVLDRIAALKDAQAIVCHVANLRISDRLLARWGWERHLWDSPLRHYIKRFPAGGVPAAASGRPAAVNAPLAPSAAEC